MLPNMKTIVGRIEDICIIKHAKFSETGEDAVDNLIYRLQGPQSRAIVLIVVSNIGSVLSW